ncbi:MAG TPA: 6-pyruvoyl-tetrahydropterin synthase-related protein [Bryobacteraceae bacterium]
MSSQKPLRIPVFIWIAGAAFLAAAPMLFLGNAWGYDFDFHTSMWMSAEQQFRHGILLPRWAAVPNAGFGEPSLIFYPPLSWMAGGVLGLILPWKFAACAYVFLALMLAGGAMWKLAADWLEPTGAVVAGILYALNPYLLATVYKRSDFGELLSGALFPLLIWAAIRIGRDGPRMIPPLAITFAAIWLADLPAGMIASYSVALLAAVGSIRLRSPRPALLSSIAMVAAFASLAFFLLPAAWERQWVEIGLVFRPDWVPENNFVFMANPDPIMLLFSRAISAIAVLLVLAGAVAAVFSRRLRRLEPNIWYLLVALGGASAFLLFRPSWIVWQILPSLRYVEYPYRWLTPLAAVDAVLVAAAIGETSRKQLLQVAAVAGTGLIGVAMLFTVRWDSHNRHMNEIVTDERNETGFRFTESKDWRLPLHSHPSGLPDFAPPVAPSDNSQGVRIDFMQLTPERKVFSVESPRPVLLKIKLLNYPAWQAKLNGRIVPLQTDPETGQMLLTSPSGFTRAEIAFTRTWDRTAGMVISYASILTLALIGVIRRRKSA